jgi:uncharacterized membrane protein YedE/YeeE
MWRGEAMKLISPLVAGLLFGLGLCLSGMTNPPKVLAFLDLAGAWDPSLAFVMGGAVIVAFAAFAFLRARGRTLGGAPAPAIPDGPIDARLIGGSALFGLGWGLVGLCPGPALADLGFLDLRALGFVLAMAAGMRLADAFFARAAAPEAAGDS